MKTMLFIVAVAFVHSAYAQEYKKLKIGLGVGLTRPRAVSAEAAYRLNDRMTVGYRLEYGS